MCSVKYCISADSIPSSKLLLSKTHQSQNVRVNFFSPFSSGMLKMHIYRVVSNYGTLSLEWIKYSKEKWNYFFWWNSWNLVNLWQKTLLPREMKFKGTCKTKTSVIFAEFPTLVASFHLQGQWWKTSPVVVFWFAKFSITTPPPFRYAHICNMHTITEGFGLGKDQFKPYLGTLGHTEMTILSSHLNDVIPSWLFNK